MKLEQIYFRTEERAKEYLLSSGYTQYLSGVPKKKEFWNEGDVYVTENLVVNWLSIKYFKLCKPTEVENHFLQIENRFLNSSFELFQERIFALNVGQVNTQRLRKKYPAWGDIFEGEVWGVDEIKDFLEISKNSCDFLWYQNKNLFCYDLKRKHTKMYDFEDMEDTLYSIMVKSYWEKYQRPFSLCGYFSRFSKENLEEMRVALDQLEMSQTFDI